MSGGAARKGGTRWRRTRAAAIARDAKAKAPCGICKGARGPIDYAAKPSTSDLSYEPDHILPVAYHPELEFDLANIQAAHKICNREKKTKASIDELGNRSREW